MPTSKDNKNNDSSGFILWLAERGPWGTFVPFVALLSTILLLLAYEASLELQEIEQQKEISSLLSEGTRGGIERVDFKPTGTDSRLVYVPVYSQIYHSNGTPILLESTISIRNTDLDHSIEILSLNYYNSEGKLIRSLMEQPLKLGPLASGDFLVERRDTAGGSGANFLIEWRAETQVNKPMIEAIMVAARGQTTFAFSRSGMDLPKSSTFRVPVDEKEKGPAVEEEAGLPQ